MTANDPTTYADDGADLAADGGDVLSAAGVEAGARALFEHFHGKDSRERYSGTYQWPPPEQHLPWWHDAARAVLAARAAADEEVRGRLAAVEAVAVRWHGVLAEVLASDPAARIMQRDVAAFGNCLDELDAALAAPVAADEEAAAVRAENARLREQVAAVRALADEWDATASGYVDPSDGPIWYAHALQRCARRIRATLDAPTAAQPEQGGAS